jgi:glutathione S-transferase
LAEKNKVESIDWATALDHKTSQFRAKQPFGSIPYIDDEGFILFGTPQF